MRHNRRFPAFLIACVAVLGLAGCESRDDLEALIGTKTDKNRVPLVRPLPLVDMAQPMVVEFELPPHGPNATPNLSIGLRLGGNQDRSGSDASLNTDVPTLAANVQLARIDTAIPTEMALVRVAHAYPARPELVRVVEGRVSGTWPDSVDRISLIEAGLSAPHDNREIRALAWMQNSEPGRYRLSVQLIRPAPAPAGGSAELLVGYVGKSK